MTPREGTAPQAGRHPKRRAATIGPAPAGRAEVVVSVDPGRSFGSIESSDEDVALLLQAVEETATDVGEDLREPVRRQGRWPLSSAGRRGRVSAW
jgi:hypothetical protein